MPLQITQSLLSAGSVAESVAEAYSVGAVQSCHLHMSGVHDVYQLTTEHGTFFFKLYRQGWRTPDQVRFETALLQHLDRQGVPVAAPVLDREEEAVRVLSLPEGGRAGVLFPSAPGQQPTWPFYQETSEARLLGAALARLHTASASFSSPYKRARLDAPGLLDAPCGAILPFARTLPDGVDRLTTAVARLRDTLDRLCAQGMTETVCHGDFHCGNVFLSAGGTVTTFDFDACGPGWVAFDLARWRSLTQSPTGADSWRAFLQGYTATAALTDADLEAIALFVPLRQLHWAQLKLTLVQRGQWDHWDTGFFVSDLLNTLAVQP